VVDYRAAAVTGSRIFISYRRGTSSAHAGRLADRLSAEFGGDYVFMDVDTIEPGADFVDYIEEAVGSCDVLIALIGGEWLECRDETGSRRLDDPEDFVRLEVGAGLERDIRVVPVLVEGAVMPRAHELPEPLQRLARRNALEVTDTRWRHDVGRLIETIHKVLEGTRPAQAIEEANQVGPATPPPSAHPPAAAPPTGARAAPAPAGHAPDSGPLAQAPGPGPGAPSTPSAAATPALRAPQTATGQPPAQAGIEPPVANLLGYLFLGIGGLIVFLTQKDREIRFHAVQSMLLAATEILLVVVLALVFGILAAIVGASPASGSYLLELRVEQLGGQVISIVVLAFLVVQAYLCVQGYRERHAKLPLLGDYAERWAGAGER